ncbi:hypothetical protein HII31_08816 [Pseudocercospora fuligena]|uniref:Stc1 domain-containing protein n=1 Tax=Pseudocercospora fuligena TaxID=685502 RepID=A0A8H6REZ0_9PEZI|nr:hypothetical protein HII31_08816 [Pseudocercospora fuligena]
MRQETDSHEPRQPQRNTPAFKPRAFNTQPAQNTRDIQPLTRPITSKNYHSEPHYCSTVHTYRPADTMGGWNKTSYNPREVAVTNVGFSDIKCNRCNIVKKVTAFAKNRIPDLQAAASKRSGFNATKTGVITCMQCNPQQVTELTCYLCDETKPLAGFPKTQRRTPDEAMCWVCKEERANFEPGAEDSDISFSNSDTDDDSEDEGFTLDSVVDQTASMSVSDAPAATYSSRSTGGIQIDGSSVVNSSTRASSTAGTSVTASAARGLPVGFNANAYGNPAAKKNLVSLANSAAGVGDPKKFAKVKAGKPNRITYDVVENERQQKEADNKEDDFEVASSDED